MKEARVLEQRYTCHTLLKNVQMSCRIIILLLARTLLAERIAIKTFYYILQGIIFISGDHLIFI